MSNANYYEKLLTSGQITPAAVEKKIFELTQTLEDEEYFYAQGVRTDLKTVNKIEKLKYDIEELRKVLAKDYTQAVARGLDPVSTTIINKPLAKSDKIEELKETYDGTRLNQEEGQEIINLLKMAREGRITKRTLLEVITSLDDQLKNTDPRSAEANDLLMRKTMLNHVVITGNFTLKRFRFYR